MTTWNFQLRLNRAPSDEEVDALFDAGLDDAAVHTGESGALLDVDREAPDPVTAVIQAVYQVDQVPGLRALGVITLDAVTLQDIAQRTGRTYESVRLLSTGRRGAGGFPAPVVEGAGVRVYSWGEVSRWFRDVHGEKLEVPGVVERLYRALDDAVRLRVEMTEMDEASARSLRGLLEVS